MSSNGGIERKRVGVGAGAAIKNSVGCIEVVRNILGVVEFYPAIACGKVGTVL